MSQLAAPSTKPSKPQTLGSGNLQEEHNLLLLQLQQANTVIAAIKSESGQEQALRDTNQRLEKELLTLREQFDSLAAQREDMLDKHRKAMHVAATTFEGFREKISNLENFNQAQAAEINELKHYIHYLEEGNSQGWKKESLFREKLGMALEDSLEKTRMVEELKEHIHQIKRSFGVIESNREMARDKQKNLEEGLQTQSEDIQKYLDRFRGLAKDHFFTYQISCVGDKDVLENNGVGLFREAVSRMTRFNHGLDNVKGLEFSALDTFLVDKFQFDRSKMDFLNLRKLNPGIFYLVQGDIPALKNVDIDDMFETRLKIHPNYLLWRNQELISLIP